MTNKEKFIEVFGFQPNTDTCIKSKMRCETCSFFWNGVNNHECVIWKWWQSEYKEKNNG